MLKFFRVLIKTILVHPSSEISRFYRKFLDCYDPKGYLTTFWNNNLDHIGDIDDLTLNCNI